MQPLNKSFNDITNHVCRSLMPQGYDTTENESLCDTLEKITLYWHEHHKVLVWSGASDKTIFVDPETNMAFRAWHDYHHIVNQFPFTMEGEMLTAGEQVVDVQSRMCRQFDYRERIIACALIDIEVVQQARYHQTFGWFVKDQYQFAKDQLIMRGLQL